MKNPKEVALYNALRKLAPGEPRRPGGQEVERLARELAIPYRQLISWLEKWVDKGWWNCGTILEGGWFEPGAPETLTIFEEPPTENPRRDSYRRPREAGTTGEHAWPKKKP